jgi:hypothetical protein
MNNRNLGVVVAVGAVVLLVFSLIARRHTQPPTALVPPMHEEASTPEPAPAPRSAPGPTFVPPPTPAHNFEPQSAPAQAPPTSRPVPGRPVRAQKFKDAVADEQLTPQKIARVALGYVGADPTADQVWLAAINNPNFTPNERKDLIEDLNEEGFDDPKNLTPADLPLIVNRIQLIENLAPQAADDTNAAAFAEAYKDLVNMYAKLTK